MIVRVSRQTDSPFWYADFKVWDASLGRWKRTFASTKIVDDGSDEAKAKALEKAEILAGAAGQVADTLYPWTLQRSEDLIARLLRSAGLPLELAGKTTTFAAFSARWLELRRRAVAASSFPAYERAIKRFADSVGGKVLGPLHAITVADVQRFWNGLVTQGMSVRTASTVFWVVSSCFERARNEGLIPMNPAKLVEQTGAEEERGREPFTADEVRSLLVACAAQGKLAGEWTTMVLLGLCTGARIGDCRRMKGEHFDGDTLRWEPEKTRRYKRGHEVPVVEPLLAHLRRLKKVVQEGLFCPVLGAYVNSAHVSELFGVVLDAAGIADKHTTGAHSWRKKSFHSLRHTLPTWLMAAGVEEAVRMKIVGHSSVRVSRKYSHAELVDLRKALEAGLKVGGKHVAPPSVNRRRAAGRGK